VKIIPIEKYKLLSSRNASISKREQLQSRLFYYSNNKYLRIAFPVFILYWFLMSVSTYNNEIWYLENILPVCSVFVLIYTYKWFRFSNRSYTIIALLLGLQILGAKFSFSLVPVNDILQLGILPKRNNYDRLVNFIFGFAFMLPAMEVSRLCLRVKGNRSVLSSILIIISAVSIYKVFEMWVFNLTPPEIGLIFLGAQGDVMDNIKDIELCFFGALSFIFYITVRYRFNEYKILKKG
jgi:Predicted membrane protein